MSFHLMPWLKRKIVDPLMQIIRRGAEPKQLALSTALGITLGVFPICGTTVFLCGLAIGLIGNHCHAPTLMLANFVATPIELSLIVPFLRLGELVSGGHHFALTSDAFKKVITGQASKDVLISIFHALLGWIIAAPIILATLYTLLVPCFKFLVHRFSNELLSTSYEGLIYNRDYNIRVPIGNLRRPRVLHLQRSLPCPFLYKLAPSLLFIPGLWFPSFFRFRARTGFARRPPLSLPRRVRCKASGISLPARLPSRPSRSLSLFLIASPITTTWRALLPPVDVPNLA